MDSLFFYHVYIPSTASVLTVTYCVWTWCYLEVSNWDTVCDAHPLEHYELSFISQAGLEIFTIFYTASEKHFFLYFSPILRPVVGRQKSLQATNIYMYCLYCFPVLSVCGMPAMPASSFSAHYEYIDNQVISAYDVFRYMVLLFCTRENIITQYGWWQPSYVTRHSKTKSAHRLILGLRAYLWTIGTYKLRIKR